MNYVFYDFETSGRSSSWDQIIEVGAVLVNDDFQVLADPLNIRCSLKPGLVPEPYALIVNNTTPQILRKTNLSHYGMLSQMVEQFNKWSPAVFVGYNSISFDEEFLRKSLFKTLNEPYLTQYSGNKRADILGLIRTAHLYYPDCIKTPMSDKGNAVFKLAELTDRRAILEEAAGIGGLHARRHEAELRLNAAENNLKKADDIMKQIELQLKNLLKQAEEASRYKTISNDIKKKEALLSYLKIQEINKELKESQEGLNEIDDDISAVTIEKNYSSELLESENKRIKPLRNDFAEITSKLQRLNLEYEDLFKQEQRTKEESEKLRIDLKNTNDDLQSENININNANSNIKRLTEEKSEILEFEKTYYEIENKTNNDFKKISEELNIEQKSLETLSEKIFANIGNTETKNAINNYLNYFKNFSNNQSRILNDTINNFENIGSQKVKENLRNVLISFEETSKNIENLYNLIKKDNEQLSSFNKEDAKNEFTQKTFLLKELQEKYAIFLSKYETIKNDSIKRKERVKSIDTEIDNWRNLEQNSKTKSESLLSRLKNLEKEITKIQIKPSEIGEQKGFYQENIKNTEEARAKINSEIECRVTTLGHVQRGARPTANDRILASAFGVHAVDLLARGKFNRMVAWQNRHVVDVAIDDAVNTYKVVDQNEGLVDTAFALGIYIGST